MNKDYYFRGISVAQQRINLQIEEMEKGYLEGLYTDNTRQSVVQKLEELSESLQTHIEEWSKELEGKDIEL